LAALLLVFLIIYLPHRIFLPYSKISRALQAIGRGESEIQLPNIEAGDELGELSRSFQEAIQKMHTFSDLKTAKISQIQRNLYRILEEVEEAILILSPDLTILYLNDSAQSLLDVDRDVVSRSVRELDMLWGLFNKLNVDLEKRGRYDVKMKKWGLGRRRISIIPSTSNSGKIDNIVIVIG
jgi:nitrogen fixation/metabolism regulation signal transduction histidine kinase